MAQSMRALHCLQFPVACRHFCLGTSSATDEVANEDNYHQSSQSTPHRNSNSVAAFLGRTGFGCGCVFTVISYEYKYMVILEPVLENETERVGKC